MDENPIEREGAIFKIFKIIYFWLQIALGPEFPLFPLLHGDCGAKSVKNMNSNPSLLISLDVPVCSLNSYNSKSNFSPSFAPSLNMESAMFQISICIRSISDL